MTTTTSASATPSLGKEVADDFHEALSAIMLDLIESGSSIATTALQNIESNPTAEEAAAQGAALAVAAPIALPTLESTVIKQLATTGLQIIAQVQAQATSGQATTTAAA